MQIEDKYDSYNFYASHRKAGEALVGVFPEGVDIKKGSTCYVRSVVIPVGNVVDVPNEYGWGVYVGDNLMRVPSGRYEVVPRLLNQINSMLQGFNIRFEKGNNSKVKIVNGGSLPITVVKGLDIILGLRNATSGVKGTMVQPNATFIGDNIVDVTLGMSQVKVLCNLADSTRLMEPSIVQDIPLKRELHILTYNVPFECALKDYGHVRSISFDLFTFFNEKLRFELGMCGINGEIRVPRF